MTVKLIVLRENKPNINKAVGDVITSLNGSQYEGREVEKVGKTFVRIIVTDMNQGDALEQDLINGIKRLRAPDLTDPFYAELLSTGKITTDTATLTNYMVTV